MAFSGKESACMLLLGGGISQDILVSLIFQGEELLLRLSFPEDLNCRSSGYYYQVLKVCAPNFRASEASSEHYGENGLVSEAGGGGYDLGGLVALERLLFVLFG